MGKVLSLGSYLPQKTAVPPRPPLNSHTVTVLLEQKITFADEAYHVTHRSDTNYPSTSESARPLDTTTKEKLVELDAAVAHLSSKDRSLKGDPRDPYADPSVESSGNLRSIGGKKGVVAQLAQYFLSAAKSGNYSEIGHLALQFQMNFAFNGAHAVTQMSSHAHAPAGNSWNLVHRRYLELADDPVTASEFFSNMQRRAGQMLFVDVQQPPRFNPAEAPALFFTHPLEVVIAMTSIIRQIFSVSSGSVALPLILRGTNSESISDESRYSSLGVAIARLDEPNNFLVVDGYGQVRTPDSIELLGDYAVYGASQAIRASHLVMSSLAATSTCANDPNPPSVELFVETFLAYLEDCRKYWPICPEIRDSVTDLEFSNLIYLRTILSKIRGFMGMFPDIIHEDSNLLPLIEAFGVEEQRRLMSNFNLNFFNAMKFAHEDSIAEQQKHLDSIKRIFGLEGI